MLYDESKVKLLSDAFVARLKCGLDATDFRKMKELNKNETDQRICHSHDFIDANIVMLNAFEECFPQTRFDFEDESHLAVVNSAWRLAKDEGRI